MEVPYVCNDLTPTSYELMEWASQQPIDPAEPRQPRQPRVSVGQWPGYEYEQTRDLILDLYDRGHIVVWSSTVGQGNGQPEGFLKQWSKGAVDPDLCLKAWDESEKRSLGQRDGEDQQTRRDLSPRVLVTPSGKAAMARSRLGEGVLTASQEPPPTVILNGRSERPIVLGKRMSRKLTKARYKVVSVLLDAGDEGLSKDELDSRCDVTDARSTLRRLRKSHPDWEKVIDMAGTPGRGYRIRQNAQDCPELPTS